MPQSIIDTEIARNAAVVRELVEMRDYLIGRNRFLCDYSKNSATGSQLLLFLSVIPRNLDSLGSSFAGYYKGSLEYNFSVS